ncbi:MAG TPA: ABC transporter ATP-binding protein [Bryobacteraceae bacterium]|nr:ABC transporter ATP-binding protein [Bryobacteraceae bacterium]
MLEAISLTKRYATVPAVSDVSFSILPHQVLGYVGPNGSGKSTTVKMITGLLQPSEGQILFRGQNIRDDLAGYKRRLGYVPEDANLYPYLSGYEYLELVGQLRGLNPRQLGKRIEEYLRLFYLHSSRHVAIATYSKGMRQRILITAALLHNPDILIFDEPLSGLDVTSALVFRHLVESLSKNGKAIFYCSHVLEVVEKVCTHVIVLRKGKVVVYGSLEELRRERAMQSLERTFSQLVEETGAEEVANKLVNLTLETA